MNVRAALYCAALVVAFPLAGAAQGVRLGTTAFDTHSGILVTQFHVVRVQDARKVNRGNPRTGAATNVCPSFTNTLARDVTQVDFRFVYYDRQRNRAGEADLIRTGRFVAGATIDPDLENLTGLTDTKDCVLLPQHDPPIGIAIAFVKSATFADGSQWTTSGPAIVDHLGPPQPDATP